MQNSSLVSIFREVLRIISYIMVLGGFDFHEEVNSTRLWKRKLDYVLFQTLIDEQETGPGAEALSRVCVKETSINQPLAGLLHFACPSVPERKDLHEPSPQKPLECSFLS